MVVSVGESLRKDMGSVSLEGSKEESKNSANTAENADEISFFESFVKYAPNRDQDQEAGCDASGILSASCYKAWLLRQKQKPSDPRTAFRDEIFLHLTGAQGRKPFKREVEAHLLSLLRVGVLGYHEMQQLQF